MTIPPAAPAIPTTPAVPRRAAAPEAAPTATPGSGAAPEPADAPIVCEPGYTVLVPRTIDEVPVVLPPGLIVVLPGGVRLRSGRTPAPAPAEPPPLIAPPVVVPPDAARTRARAAELTRLVVEVLTGRRTPDGIAGVATARVLRYLAAVRPGVAARASLASPGRAGRVGAPGCGSGPMPPRVHVGLPHGDAAEVCTTAVLAGRPRALALRLDRRGTGAPWIVTAVRMM